MTRSEPVYCRFEMTFAPRPVRVGNAQAFWGDRTDAAAEMLAREPELDYLTLDYLAEVSMSILAMQRERDPNAGYAREFVEVVRALVPYWTSGGRCRLIANAGGLNPQGCAEACRMAIAKAGCRSLRIGVVSGDDILELIRAAANTSSPDFQNLDTGAKLQEVRDRLVTANAYLGASPIVDALAGGADIVITGRVADPSLVVAPCIHHFGWSEKEMDRLAGATVAGHLIECGTQVTGGISTDWLDIPDVAHIGFPFVEVFDDGSCIVTKPRGTGGRVTEMTVKEQLLYEIGDPDNYLSPDVAVSFLSLMVDDLGNDRVRVSGAIGKPRPEKLKVSATFRDGFRSAGTLTIIGRNAATKARRVGELALQRVRDAGFELRDSIIECLGSGDGAASIIGNTKGTANAFDECVLRVAVESETHEAAERFSLELMPNITAGPQGTTGYAEGRPRVHPIIRYWPCLIEREAVAPQIASLSATKSSTAASVKATRAEVSHSISMQVTRSASADCKIDANPIHLFDIAIARSGDKGSSATIGIIARSNEHWKFLQTWLTAERVSNFLSPLRIDAVDRFELPNLSALNFVVHGALRQGLRTDAQGKALGQILLEIPLPSNFALSTSYAESE
jgi:hypothetical protein